MASVCIWKRGTPAAARLKLLGRLSVFLPFNNWRREGRKRHETGDHHQWLAANDWLIASRCLITSRKTLHTETPLVFLLNRWGWCLYIHIIHVIYPYIHVRITPTHKHFLDLRDAGSFVAWKQQLSITLNTNYVISEAGAEPVWYNDAFCESVSHENKGLCGTVWRVCIKEGNIWCISRPFLVLKAGWWKLVNSGASPTYGFFSHRVNLKRWDRKCCFWSSNT